MRPLLCLLLLFSLSAAAQLPVARDTITVIENNYVLKMNDAGGFNYPNVSGADINGDGKSDLVVFDRPNQFSPGVFKVFLYKGPNEEYRYSAAYSALFPACQNWALLRDYNCDGKADIFCSTPNGIGVYQNIGTTSAPSFSLVKQTVLSDYNPGGNPYLVNIYSSPVGFPGIADVDNDGDIDVLSFSPQGIFIQFHKNMSKERYNHCDSLVYIIDNYCYGKISESSCQVNINACTSGSAIAAPQGVKHAGSCLTCFDSDGDADMDLIMGDVSCDLLQYAHNTGSVNSPLYTDTTALFPNYPWKGSTTVAHMNFFPCSYMSDVNNDGHKDLLVSPSAFGTESFKSLWYYKNAPFTGTANFSIMKKNLLQDEMIETGQNAFPTLIDINSDGLLDLLIGNYGYYNGNSMVGSLTLYENKGTNSAPVYSLISRDYCSVTQKNLQYLVPAVGDIDYDGDVDIVLGSFGGQIHWIENTAGAAQPCIFSNFKTNPFSFTTTSSCAAPCIIDVDNDNYPDLLIGMKNGRVAYYRNTGTSGAPSFSLITNTFGNINVQGDLSLYGLDGYAVPFAWRENGLQIMVGSISGDIAHYLSYDNTNFTKISSKVNALSEGLQTSVCYMDINNDNKRDLIIGNAGGGLSWFSSKGLGAALNEPINANAITVFPNPTQNNLHITQNAFYANTCEVYDVTGQFLLHQPLTPGDTILPTDTLPSGIYILRFTTSDGVLITTRKLIVNK